MIKQAESSSLFFYICFSFLVYFIENKWMFSVNRSNYEKICEGGKDIYYVTVANGKALV